MDPLVQARLDKPSVLSKIWWTLPTGQVSLREEGGDAVEPLPSEALRAVPHVAFWVFNLAIPNIIVWGVVILVFVLACWARLPKILESES
jgi:hypothetical protein